MLLFKVLSSNPDSELNIGENARIFLYIPKIYIEYSKPIVKDGKNITGKLRNIRSRSFFLVGGGSRANTCG